MQVSHTCVVLCCVCCVVCSCVLYCVFCCVVRLFVLFCFVLCCVVLCWLSNSRGDLFLGTGYSTFSLYIRLMRANREQIIDTTVHNTTQHSNIDTNYNTMEVEKFKNLNLNSKQYLKEIEILRWYSLCVVLCCVVLCGCWALLCFVCCVMLWKWQLLDMYIVLNFTLLFNLKWRLELESLLHILPIVLY